MNLAQLIGELLLRIDNEHEAHFHGYRPRAVDGIPARIYNTLVQCGKKEDWPSICKLANITREERQRAAHALLDLVECHHVQRDGKRRKYKYWAIRRA